MNFKKYIYNVQKIKKELTIRGDKKYGSYERRYKYCKSNWGT